MTTMMSKELAVPQAGLTVLALQLRADLVDLAEATGACRELDKAMNSADVLIAAINDMREVSSALPPSKKAAPVHSVTVRKGIIPKSLH